MIPSAHDDEADWLRARRAQAAQARRQAEHHRRLAMAWDERAIVFESDIAAVQSAAHISQDTEERHG